jgi:hypothetical protein
MGKRKHWRWEKQMSRFYLLPYSTRGLAVTGLAAGLALAGAAAQADTLTADPLSNGTAALASAATWATTSGSTALPANVAGNPNGSSGTGLGVNDLTANAAGTYTFMNSFSGTTATFGNATITPPGGSAEAIGFMDTYIIAVPAASSNAFAFSLSLQSNSGLSDLSLRMYQYASGTYPSLTSVNPNVVYSGSLGTSLIDAWSTNTLVGSTDTTSLPTITLAAGEYVLQVAGLSNGSTGGVYSGQMALSPVPLPPSVLLLLSGVGVLGGFALRKRTTSPSPG